MPRLDFSSQRRRLLAVVVLFVCCFFRCNSAEETTIDVKELEKDYACANQKSKLPEGFNLGADDNTLIFDPSQISANGMEIVKDINTLVGILALDGSKKQNFTIDIWNYDQMFGKEIGMEIVKDDHGTTTYSCQQYFRDQYQTIFKDCNYGKEEINCASNRKCNSTFTGKCQFPMPEVIKTKVNGVIFFLSFNLMWAQRAIYEQQPCTWRMTFKNIRVLIEKSTSGSNDSPFEECLQLMSPTTTTASKSTTTMPFTGTTTQSENTTPLSPDLGTCVTKWPFILAFAFLGVLLIAVLIFMVFILVRLCHDHSDHDTTSSKSSTVKAKSTKSKHEVRMSKDGIPLLAEEKTWIPPPDPSPDEPESAKPAPPIIVDDMSTRDDLAYKPAARQIPEQQQEAVEPLGGAPYTYQELAEAEELQKKQERRYVSAGGERKSADIGMPEDEKKKSAKSEGTAGKPPTEMMSATYEQLIEAGANRQQSKAQSKGIEVPDTIDTGGQQQSTRSDKGGNNKWEEEEEDDNMYEMF